MPIPDEVTPLELHEPLGDPDSRYEWRRSMVPRQEAAEAASAREAFCRHAARSAEREARARMIAQATQDDPYVNPWRPIAEVRYVEVR